MLEDDKKVEELVVPPFQRMNSWIESAKQGVSSSLAEALGHIGKATAETEKKAAAAMDELKETSKTSTQKVTDATVNFFKNVGTWFKNTWNSISTKSDALTADLEYLLLPHGQYRALNAKREGKKLEGIDGERLERAAKAFKQALEESGKLVEGKVESNAQQVTSKRDESLAQIDKSESVDKVLGALTGFRGGALNAINNMENAANEGIAKVEGGFRAYRDEMRDATKGKGDEKKADVSHRLSDFQAEMSGDIQAFRDKAAPGFAQARANVRSPVARAMELVKQRELGEVLGVRLSAMVAANRIQAAFDNLCGTAKDFLYREGPRVIGEADTIINEKLLYTIHGETCDNFIEFTAGVKDGVNDGLSRTSTALGAAQERMNQAVSSFEQEIGNLTDVKQLDQLAGKLTAFQQDTVNIIKEALDAVHKGRQAVLDGANKFEAEAIRIADAENLSAQPKEALQESLKHFKGEVAKVNRGVEVEALGDLNAVIKLSDKEMQRVIADIPYKALSSVPYRGVGEWIKDAKAEKDGLDPKLADALKELDRNVRAAENGLAVAIRNSNAKIANAFKVVMEVLKQAWDECCQKVVKFYNDQTKEGKLNNLLEQWKEVEQKILDRTGRIDNALKAAGEKVDTEVKQANETLGKMEGRDLDATKKALVGFSGRTTEALGTALRDLEAEYIDMEKELGDLDESLKGALGYSFKDALRESMQEFGRVVDLVDEEVETAVRDPYGTIGNVVPFKGVGHWVEEAKQTKAQMDPALEQALTSIAKASSGTEQKAAEAAQKLRDTGKESTKTVAKSTGKFFQDTAQWFIKAQDSVSKDSESLYKVLDKARQEAKKVVGGWQGERMQKAYDAFKQALNEQRGKVENTAGVSTKAVNEAVLAAGSKLDNAQSMQEVIGALTEFLGTTLKSIDGVERTTDHALSSVGSEFAKFQKEAREDVLQSGMKPATKNDLRDAIWKAGGKVTNAIADSRGQLATGVIDARLTAVSPVARAMELVAERELREVNVAWATAVMAGDKVHRGFSNMCTQVRTYFANLGSGLISSIDKVVAETVDGLSHSDAIKMRDAAHSAGDAVVQKSSAVHTSLQSAQDDMSKAVDDLYGKIRDVKRVDQLDGIKDLLEGFQRESVLIMADALKAIKTGREGITEEANKFEQEARRLGDDLDKVPKQDMDLALQELREGVKGLSREIETKGLGQLKSMVQMADKAMRGAIADLPYKALASVPFKGTKQWLRDARSEKEAAKLDPELREALKTIEDAAKASENKIEQALRVCAEWIEALVQGIEKGWNAMLGKIDAHRQASADWTNEMDNLWNQMKDQVKARSDTVDQTLKGAGDKVKKLCKEAAEKTGQAKTDAEKGRMLEEFFAESSKIMADVLNTANDQKEGLRQDVQKQFANDNLFQDALQGFKGSTADVLSSLENFGKKADSTAKGDPDLGFSAASVSSAKKSAKPGVTFRFVTSPEIRRIEREIEENNKLQEKIEAAIAGLAEAIDSLKNPQQQPQINQQQQSAEQEQEAQQQRGGGRGR
ncbi:MAG: hypothetical protein ACTJLL_04880 [Anaplasma sp.]